MTDQVGPILIVGAGPVGLTAALELTRRGFPVRIIDEGPGPHTESRAVAVNPRTLELLEPCGVTPKLLEAGLKLRALNIHLGNGRTVRIETRHVDHRFNFMLALPQSETEHLMIETLSQPIEWNTRLTSLDVAGGQPIATLLRDGTDETFSPGLVLGADGARSAVRRALGIGFAGKEYPNRWSLADIVAASPYNRHELNAFELAPYIVACIPLNRELTRVISNHPDVVERLPPKMVAERIVWESKFSISHRIVETMQKGAVYLAGDAAHIHSPVGGRGMNLGIADACWLAWLIERGETADYTKLRRPVAERVIRATDLATRMISSSNFAARWLRRLILPRVAASERLQRLVLRNLMGLTARFPPWL